LAFSRLFSPLTEPTQTPDRGGVYSVAPGDIGLASRRALLRLHEDKTFDAVDSAKAHADQLAAKLGRNKSAHEILGRFVRVTDEDGEEVYRAPLTNRV
jgi:hypothetical protein